MRIIDPGHVYLLRQLDSLQETELRFVKRIGVNFPGNAGPAFPGTTSQEVIRELIDRTKYVDNQHQSLLNQYTVVNLREALHQYELRVAIVRDEAGRYRRMIRDRKDTIENLPICLACGHIDCGRHP